VGEAGDAAKKVLTPLASGADVRALALSDSGTRTHKTALLIDQLANAERGMQCNRKK
jgi:hypothetical protein